MRYNIGLDIGIASVGFAVMELDENDLPIKIIRNGSRIFDVAENPKDGASLALPRREARGARRRTRRSKHRKERIRDLMVTQNILTKEQLNALYNGQLVDIYELRAQALDRIVSNEELSRILLHLVQRRGFKSNRKTEKASKEDGLLLSAVNENKKVMSEKSYRTVGEMLCKDKRYAEYKRNKSENYLNTVSRDMVAEEVREIFSRQRELGNSFCAADFEENYLKILLSQRSFEEGPGKLSDGSQNPYAIARLNLPTYTVNETKNLKPIFVSRMPKRTVSGAAHKETIRGIGENNTTVSKVLLNKLKLDKDGEITGYFNPGDDRLLYEALKARLIQFDGNGEKAFAEPFHKPKSDGTPGPLVKKVKIEEKSTLNVAVHNKTGVADNDSMVRVDVFFVEGDGYYLVPIYVADTMKDELPNKAIVANKPYEEWKEMNDEDFMFSIYPNDLIFVKSKKSMNFVKVNEESKLPNIKELAESFVYYKGADINGGKISIINHDNSYKTRTGVKTLPLIEKYQVDVLGNISKVGFEPRQGFGNQRR